MVAFLSACKKDEAGTPLSNIRYEVDGISGNQVDISYYSDLYYESGELKQISLNNNGSQYLYNYWTAERLQSNKDQGYYIRVDYNKYLKPSTILQKVNVYLNDTVLIDSYTGNSNIPVVELKGTIPRNF